MTRAQQCRPAGGKHCHATQGAALASASRSSLRSRMGMRAYRCPFGDHWHISSLPNDGRRWINVKFDLRLTDQLLDAAPVSDIDTAARWLTTQFATPAHLVAELLAAGRTRIVVNWDGQRRVLEWHHLAGWAELPDRAR